jgi:aldose 1-epimerase
MTAITERRGFPSESITAADRWRPASWQPSSGWSTPAPSGGGRPIRGSPHRDVICQTRTRNAAGADTTAIFPFPHRVELAVTLGPTTLTIETALTAGPDRPVSVSFGFHPYIGLPRLPRADWRLELPVMRKLALDERGIPTSEETPFAGFDAALGEVGFDDGFALPEERVSMSLAGAGCRITVELVAGYQYTQVFAPADKD